MISFSLRCRPASHAFDGWFRSSADWERQNGLGLVACPVCGSAVVEKGLMAPAVVTARGEAPASRADADADAGAAPPKPPAAPEPSGRAVVSALGGLPAPPPPEIAEAFARLQALAREVRAKADYVGERFAQEARRIHFGEAPARAIFGEATRAEVEDLGEDGILALPMPPLPEDRN